MVSLERGDCVVYWGEGCKVSRMVGQEEKHGRLPRLGTHSALSEAWACTQHRCWKKLGEGIEKRCGGGGGSRHASLLGRSD